MGLADRLEKEVSVVSGVKGNDGTGVLNGVYGVMVRGVVSRLAARHNEHGTFYSALIEWLGGRAYVELARDEEGKVEEGQVVTLAVQVRAYVTKDGGAGYSFNYGRCVG